MLHVLHLFSQGFNNCHPDFQRHIEWTDRNLEDLKDYMTNFTTNNAKISKVNVALFGRSGSGKSSTVNAMNSAMMGRKASFSPVSHDNEESVTVELRMFHLYTKGGQALNIRLFDMIGFHTNDWDNNTFNSLLQGGFKTKQICSKEMEVVPNEMNEIHVVAFVVDITKKLDTSLKNYIDLAHKKGWTAFLLVTKVDLWMANDVKHIYENEQICQKLDVLSQGLGITLQYVYPIMNYCTQQETNQNTDILNLTSLKAIICAANDRIMSKND